MFKYRISTNCSNNLWQHCPVDHGVTDHHNEGGQQILEQEAGVHVHQTRHPNWPTLMMDKMQQDLNGFTRISFAPHSNRRHQQRCSQSWWKQTVEMRWLYRRGNHKQKAVKPKNIMRSLYKGVWRAVWCIRLLVTQESDFFSHHS